jgi:hypothetical protein
MIVTRDVKHGLVIGVAFASLVAMMPIKAEEESSFKDDEICEKSVKYSFKWMPEEDDSKLHQARWNILEGDKADDIQKMVGLVVFEMGQRLGYAFDSDTMGGDEWWKETVARFNAECEDLLEGLRKSYGYGDGGLGMESANPEEVW